MQTPTNQPNILKTGQSIFYPNPEDLATKILHDAKITQLPVNLYQIADSLKITVSEDKKSDGTMGYVVEGDDRIVLNSNFNNPRFALALILGDIVCRHIALRHFRWAKDRNKWAMALSVFTNSMPPKQFIKRQNHLALAILMPKKQFMKKYNSGEPYENIAADFDVTDEDFGHRLDTLGL